MMTEKSVCDMTRKEFDALPHRKWDEDIGLFDSLVVLPGKARDLHDSGYRCMDFVAVKNGKPICRLSGGSDVIHIEGIGGLGKNWLSKYNTVPSMVPPSRWSIDCLPKSGLLQFFGHPNKISCGAALSSFEIYSVEERKV